MKTDNTKDEKINKIIRKTLDVLLPFILLLVFITYLYSKVLAILIIYVLIGIAITKTEGLKFWQKCICWTAYPILIPFVETRIFFKRFWSKNNG